MATTYTYDPSGLTMATGVETTNAFAYTGRETEVDGLYYYRARYHHSASGRFISEDPVSTVGTRARLLNRYVYALNNPQSLIDRDGRAPTPTDIVGGTIVGGMAGLVTGAGAEREPEFRRRMIQAAVNEPGDGRV